jgi:XRE family aerobic/anaerobic benzoate catabolism transcriptional regulator
MEELRSILTSRESLYAQAEAVVDTSGRTLKQSTKDLVDIVRKLEVI